MAGIPCQARFATLEKGRSTPVFGEWHSVMFDVEKNLEGQIVRLQLCKKFGAWCEYEPNLDYYGEGIFIRDGYYMEVEEQESGQVPINTQEGRERTLLSDARTLISAFLRAAEDGRKAPDWAVRDAQEILDRIDAASDVHAY